MKNKEKYFTQISVFLLILLWVYAAVSKLLDFSHFQKQMDKQVLYPFMRTILIYMLPPAEIIMAGLLSFEYTRNKGLYISALSLALFTGYVALAVFHIFKQVPCSCGGILEHISWRSHLYFNLFFLAITVITIFLIKRKDLK